MAKRCKRLRGNVYFKEKMNQKHPDIKNEFFTLVRAGLWGTPPDSSLFNSDTPWEEIHRVGKSQALLGILLDGIELLPAGLYPPRPLYLKWCAEVLEIEDHNQKLDTEVAALFRVLRKHDVSPILMKGQAIALNYPVPNHRSCGDIDIFIGKKDYDKVNEILSVDGKALEKWSPKHMMFEWHDVIVENHRILANLASPRSIKNLDRLTDEWKKPEKTCHVNIGDEIVVTPSLEFDAVFLLLHSVVHLMGFGIGLRQTCDWALFLNKKKSELNRKETLKILKDLGMTNAARIFGAMAVKYLGMPEDDLLLPIDDKDRRYGDQLLDDIWENGNFGYSKGRIRKLPKGWLRSRIYNFGLGISRLNKLYKVAPREAVWLPVWRFKNFLKRRL